MLLKQKSYDLTEGPVRKMLVLFVLPIIAGSLFQQLYTTADAAIVGRFAGKQALAAIDAVYNLIRLPTVFFYRPGFGGDNPHIAALWGEEKRSIG